MGKNPFDFNDLSDLPEDLQDKLTVATNGSVNEIVKVVAAGKEAGFDALSLNQIKAAGLRMGIELPTDATIRAWLNTGVEQGKLTKPSRQTYAIAGAVVPTGHPDVAPVEEVSTVPADLAELEDPLADL